MRTLFKESLTTPISKSYDIGLQIGTGKFSVVKSAVEKSTGKSWALKMMKKSVVQEQNIVKEVEIMMEVKNPNIIGLHEIYESDSEIILVLELVTGGELFDKIVEKESYTEEDASKLINTLTKVIHYLHNKDIVHCDLKPENLLYSDTSNNAVIKLCDFGLSQRCPSGTVLRSMVGTFTYMAPEINNGAGYGKPVDMWALGVIIYILLCGYPPFDETTGYNLEFPSPDWDHISDSAKGLIKALLNVDPLKRLTVTQTLKNPWVSGVSTGKESIIGTLKTLREFNTMRRSGTTMGHKGTTRSSVFELFPSLTPTKEAAPAMAHTVATSNPYQSPLQVTPPSSTTPAVALPSSPIMKSKSCQNIANISNPNNTNNNNNTTTTTVTNTNPSSSSSSSKSTSTSSSPLPIITTSSSSPSPPTSTELDKITTVTTPSSYQDILKKQLMSSLEVGSDSSFDSDSDTSSNLADQDRYSPELLAESLNGASTTSPSVVEFVLESADDKQTQQQQKLQQLEQQLQQERDTNSKLLKELEQLRKQSSSSSTPTTTYTTTLSSNSSLSAGFSLLSSSPRSSPLSHSRNSSYGGNGSSDTESTKKDKSKHGVDRIVSDLQSEFDKLFLSKETMEKLNNVMSQYKQKNQEKSLKLELERQKEKYKKLKQTLKSKK